MTGDSLDQQDASRRARRGRIWDVSAITAIVSLVVALVFNGLQVRDNASEAAATRRATELQLLTQLNGLVSQTQATIEPRGEEIEHDERTKEIGPQTNRNFAVLIKNMDYLAWLFNNHFVSIRGSQGLWAERMKCLYLTGELIYGPELRHRVLNLKRFVKLPEGQSIRSMDALREEIC